ncbi:MAG: EamA family transporter [Oscillospiraceae bacterium]|nr:EamA family transporter [Oscillospiraceae bacterium]
MQGKKAVSLPVHIAVFLFGFAGILGKMVKVHSLALTFGRVVFSSLALGIFVALKRYSIKLGSKKEYALIVIAGVILAAHWTCFMQAVQVSTVAIATVSVSTVPLFTTFLEPLIYKEKLKVISVVEAVLMLVGVFIMVDMEAGVNTLLGVLFGLAGSLAYAVLSLINRTFTKKYTGVVISLYEQGIAGLALLPVILVIRPVYSGHDIIVLAILGVLCTAIAHSLYIVGLRRIKVQTAGVICGMEPVYGIILAIFILNQIPGIREIIGCIIVLAVTVYTTMRAGKDEMPPAEKA